MPKAIRRTKSNVLYDRHNLAAESKLKGCMPHLINGYQNMKVFNSYSEYINVVPKGIERPLLSCGGICSNSIP